MTESVPGRAAPAEVSARPARRGAGRSRRLAAPFRGAPPASYALALVLLAGLGLRLWFLARPLDWLVSFFPADDYFYYLQTAFHLARGDGSTFDGLTRHNGYQPLLTWLLVVPFWLGASKSVVIYVGLGLLSAAGLVAAWLAHRVTVLLGGSRWAALAPAAALSLGLYWVKLGLSGFEPMLALALLLATVESVLRGRRAWVTGLLLGLAGLARVDSVLLVPGLALLLGARDRRRLLVVGLVAAAVCLPWAVWSFARFGTVLPQSGAVKMLMGDPGYLREGVETFLGAIGPLLAGQRWLLLLPGLLLTVAGLLVLADALRAWRRAWWLLSFVVLLVLAYSILTDPRDHVQHVRYVSPAIAILGVVFFSRRRRLAFLWPAAVLAATIASDLEFHRWAAGAPPLDTYVGRCQRDVPAVLARVVRPGDLVGCFDAGAAGYFAPVPVVNLDGLVNTEIVSLLRGWDPAAGNWADLYARYWRERGVTILIGGTAYGWSGLFPDLAGWEPLHTSLPSTDGGDIVFLRVPRR